MRTLLFVCTGNTCRSPMAEAIARHLLDGGALGSGLRSSEIFVASAGISAVDGAMVSNDALQALKKLGIDHRGSAKRLTAAMIRRADVILTMTEGHAAAARRLVADEPDQLAKIMPLDSDGDIEDPIGQGASAYHATAQRMREVMPKRLTEALAART